MTHDEQKINVELGEEEKTKDERMRTEELQVIGGIGNKLHSKTRFTIIVLGIEKEVKKQTQKIYKGDNEKYLIGSERIPVCLQEYIKENHEVIMEFRLECIRTLRDYVNNYIKIEQ